MSKTRGKRPALKARSKNARKAKRVTNVLAVMHVPQQMCFVERFVAPAPEYRPLVVVSLSGLMLFGMRVGTRFCVHVPLEDTHRDYCDMLQLSHWMEVIHPLIPSTAKAEAATAQPEFLPPEHVESLEDIGQQQA